MKKIAIAIARKPELQPPQFKDNPHWISLDVPLRILREWDNEIDLDELQCILSNIIAIGFIKGYISNEKSVLVLAKDIN